ncbi:YheC/YheD family protein [Oceanobacillus jeddahense]|uniref:YheC/YheD family protein n=1 Tax=Oceanobacillus jeddahense TaxID=1462527 RepID=UPI000595BEC2|nr:YheC/YheD family protein [Oceanobacillus jeddahense]
MLVGLMQPFKEPTDLAKHISIEAKSKGIDILYMTPSDVNEENNSTSGMILNGNTWEATEGNIPEIIDVSSFCLKSKETIKYLEEYAYLTEDGRNKLSKESIQKVLEEDSKLQKYAIPTSRCKTFSIIKGFLLKYGEVVVKPVYNPAGENIYKIEQLDKDEFIVSHQNAKTKMTLKETFVYFQQIISKRKYIVQKYIPSRTEQDEPFNCRIHLEKNKEGKWVIVKKYIRVGTDQIVSPNNQQAGVTFDASMFLKLKFIEEAPSVDDHLDAAALSLAKKIEQTRKKELATLGLDIGIDKDKHLFLFEANSAPDASLLQEEVAALRTDYYAYLVAQNAERAPKEFV